MKTFQQIREAKSEYDFETTKYGAKKEASGDKEAYQKFFNGMLKKFGVKSASELEGDKKKEFYDAIDAGWEGDNEAD